MKRNYFPLNYHDIEPLKLRYGLVHHLLNFRLLTDVALDCKRDCVRGPLLDKLFSGLESSFVDIGQDDLTALLGEQEGALQSYATVTESDDHGRISGNSRSSPRDDANLENSSAFRHGMGEGTAHSVLKSSRHGSR